MYIYFFGSFPGTSSSEETSGGTIMETKILNWGSFKKIFSFLPINFCTLVNIVIRHFISLDKIIF